MDLAVRAHVAGATRQSVGFHQRRVPLPVRAVALLVFALLATVSCGKAPAGSKGPAPGVDKNAASVGATQRDPSALQALRQRIKVAKKGGLSELQTLRSDLLALTPQDGELADAALAEAFEAVAPLCQAESDAKEAIPLAATLASAYARSMLAKQLYPTDAIDMLERVGSYRDQIGIDACEPTLLLAYCYGIVDRADDATAVVQGFFTGVDSYALEELLTVREQLLATAQWPGSVGEQVMLRSFEAFLRHCKVPAAAVDAAPFAAGIANEYAKRKLVSEWDAKAAIDMLVRISPYHEQAGYRACGVAQQLSDAYSALGHVQKAEAQLDACDEILTSEATKNWDAQELLMKPIERLANACRRAALALQIGNPDAMLPHLKEAKRILAAKRGEPDEEWEAHFDQAWYDAKARFRREEIDYLLGTDQFHVAASVAKQGIEEANQAEDAEHAWLLGFYLAIARSWLPDTKRVAEELQRYAESESPMIRYRATERLFYLFSNAGELDKADQQLEALKQQSVTLVDSEVRTAQTELLLLRDRHESIPVEQLLAQKERQREAFEELLDNWNAAPTRDGGVGFLHFLFRRETIGQFLSITLRAATEKDGVPSQEVIAEALQYIISTQTKSTLARSLDVEAPTVAEIQALLGPKQGVLVYLPTRSGTHLFAIGAEQIDYRGLPNGAMQIRSEVQRLLELLEEATGTLEPSTSEAKKMAAQLHEAGTLLRNKVLPESLRPQLANWHNVTVIGSELLHGPVSGERGAGLLNYVPLECLPWADGRLFGQQFAVDHNVSLPVWAKAANTVRPYGHDSDLRMFGTLRAAGANGGDRRDASNDQLSERAIPGLAATFPKHQLLLNAKATLTAVTDRSSGQPASGRSIAVFLAHGGYDAGRERGSYLQLFDGRLDCQTAQQLGSVDKPFANLIIIAACRAAKAPTRAGDSLANLGGAFQLAGAETVVQSRFDLPLYRTQTLLGDAFEQLADGACVAEAMRAARAKADAKDPLDAYRTGVLQVHGIGQAHRKR
jgi:hypothetical protein